LCKSRACSLAPMKGIPLVPIYNGDRYIQQQIIGGLDRRD
jgi:hypothetical protein